MMHHASQGVRNGLRKGFVRHSGHNGPGSGTTANATSRSLHMSSNLGGLSRMAQPLTPISLEAIRPPHRLFAIAKTVLQRLFNNLTASRFRAPTYFAQSSQVGTRSLNNAAFRGNSIQSGLSFAVRASLKNNAFHRQATMFLPRAPTPPPPRCGGVTQVGLGTARNFTTGRPIFQQLADNVPIAARALYEADWGFEMQKELAHAHVMATEKSNSIKKVMSKPIQRGEPPAATLTRRAEDTTPSRSSLDHYFPSVIAVTTFLYIPLAPRMPLPQNPGVDELTLLPIPDLAALHSSYATHNLRVKTLFTRLEQADVWSHGVSCCGYSQGFRNRIQDLNGEEAGVCTNLKLVFEGWTKSEVRSVIGESGTGWCALEEVWDDQVSEVSEALSEASLSLGSISRAESPTSDEIEFMDPSQSFVMPKLAFSSSFLVSDSQLSSSGSSSYSDLSDLSV